MHPLRNKIQNAVSPDAWPQKWENAQSNKVANPRRQKCASVPPRILEDRLPLTAEMENRTVVIKAANMERFW